MMNAQARRKVWSAVLIVGFFLLWIGAFAPAALTAYMLDSSRGSRVRGAEVPQ